MTQPVAQPRHAVARSGFANPLTLGIKVTTASFVKVYADDMLLQLGFDYTIDGLGDPAGIEITIIDGEDAGSYADVDTFAAVFSPLFEQGADLSAGGNFGLAFESAIDALNRQIQALDDRLRRSLTLPPTYESDDQLSFPLPSAGRVLVGNATNTGFENGATLPEIETIVGLTDQIVLLTGIAPQIVEVAAVDSQIVTLAPVAASIGALGPVAASVAALAPQAANIATLAPQAANIGLVGGSIAAVVVVANAIANVNIVATNITSVNTAAANMAVIIAAPGAASAAAASAVAAAASASSINMPAVPVALNYLRRNAGNTAYEVRTPAQVAADISVPRYDATAALTQAQKGQLAANIGQAWEIVQGGYVDLASGAANVLWTGLGAYRALRLTGHVLPVTADANFSMRYGAGTPDSSAAYRREFLSGVAALSSAAVLTGLTGADISAAAGNANHSYAATISALVYEFNKPRQTRHIATTGSITSAGGDVAGLLAGSHSGATAFDVLQVFASAGTIGAGGFLMLEGLRG